jgi:protein TonB
MTPVYTRRFRLLVVLLCVAFAAPASAAKPERIHLAALTQPELPISAPLTAEEARSALERELSLKVGKHMRQTDYPDEAQRWGWSGTVLVEVSVTSEGLVDAVALSRTSGYQILDERALEVVRRVPRLFVPVQLRGRPQRAVVPISFHFQSP